MATHNRSYEKEIKLFIEFSQIWIKNLELWSVENNFFIKNIYFLPILPLAGSHRYPLPLAMPFFL
jgi:hypothetical protein